MFLTKKRKAMEIIPIKEVMLRDMGDDFFVFGGLYSNNRTASSLDVILNGKHYQAPFRGRIEKNDYPDLLDKCLPCGDLLFLLDDAELSEIVLKKAKR